MQACAWTGACKVAGCNDTCVIDADIGGSEESINALFMRQTIDVIACPLVASFIQPYAGDLLKIGSKAPLKVATNARRLFGSATSVRLPPRLQPASASASSSSPQPAPAFSDWQADLNCLIRVFLAPQPHYHEASMPQSGMKKAQYQRQDTQHTSNNLVVRSARPCWHCSRDPARGETPTSEYDGCNQIQ